MKKKILIIGGTGFIGYHLAKKCIKNKLDVTSLSRSKPSEKRKIDKVKYIYADITDKNLISLKIKEKYDYVVNLGGDVNHHSKNTFKSHYIGCKNLVEYFEKKKIKKFIQIGSSVEYGNFKSPHSEDDLILKVNQLKSIYAKAKLKTTKYLIKIFKKKKFPVTVFRIYLASGPGQDVNRIIPFTIKNCLQNKIFPCSKGNQYRDFIYISDVVEILFKSLKLKNSNGEIFNICTGKPSKIKNLIKNIQLKIKGGKPQFGLIKMRKDEVKYFFGNPKKTNKIFGYKPKVALGEGLTKTINYYANNFKKRV